MEICPRCYETMIWQNDFDSGDPEEQAVYTDYFCQACETHVTYKDPLEYFEPGAPEE